MPRSANNQTRRNKALGALIKTIISRSRGALGLGHGVKPHGKELAVVRGGSRTRRRRRASHTRTHTRT